ncbi:unnamed protein product [Nippostrongylus brasiliensis]|uniref:Secreted protein n=1 Tax=Nippostrongylus brasiliensis TaxID=27835 RepID=A0A0N4YI85_NIPBR|nr:unnamed protein product [Nippostrongylus brasiliensis]
MGLWLSHVRWIWVRISDVWLRWIWWIRPRRMGWRDTRRYDGCNVRWNDGKEVMTDCSLIIVSLLISDCTYELSIANEYRR